MPTYFTADSDVQDLVANVLAEHHADLANVDVKVSVLMACASIDEKTGDPKGPAVTHNGYPAAAVIRVVPIKQRVQGMADIEITIDGDRWDGIPSKGIPPLTQEQRVALIDHELEHLELKRDKNGHVKVDDYNRPLFKLRRHDWEIGGFDSIVKRHGDNALEMLAFRDATQKERPVGQLLFNFG